MSVPACFRCEHYRPDRCAIDRGWWPHRQCSDYEPEAGTGPEDQKG